MPIPTDPHHAMFDGLREHFRNRGAFHYAVFCFVLDIPPGGVPANGISKSVKLDLPMVFLTKGIRTLGVLRPKTKQY